MTNVLKFNKKVEEARDNLAAELDSIITGFMGLELVKYGDIIPRPSTFSTINLAFVLEKVYINENGIILSGPSIKINGEVGKTIVSLSLTEHLKNLEK